MSLLQYGNTGEANEHQAASAGANTSTFTEVAAYFDFIFPGTVGNSSQNIFIGNPNQSNGLRVYVFGSSLRVAWRTSGLNSGRIYGDLTPGARYRCWVRASLLDGTLQYAMNGVEAHAPDDISGQSFLSTAIQPSILGSSVDGVDFEWFNAAIFATDAEEDSENPGQYIGTRLPSFAEMLAVGEGDDISALPGVYIGTNFQGTNGAFADTLVDYVSGNNFAHIAGDTTNANNNRPVFVGAAEITAGATTLTSMAVDLAYTAGVTGTTHIMVGLASANPSNPISTQIKAGQNQNGTSASTKESFTENSTGLKERRLTGLFSSTNYKAFAVIETETDVFTSVISWTFTTPRIGLRTDPIYTPGSSPALWASQTAINIAVAAQGMPSVVDTAETDSSGRLVVDLSEAEGFYLPVGGAAKVGWEKGSNFGFQSATIENLDA